MFELLVALPLLILFIFFAAVFFIGMLIVFVFRLFTKTINSQNKNYANPYPGQYKQVIDLKEQENKKIILIISIIVIICILILANFIKIDSSGKIYLPQRPKIENKNYI